MERVVAAARALLATVSFVAIWLDPSTPARYADATYALLGLYAAYAIVALVFFWRARFVSRHRALLAHVLDLVVFSLLMYLTEGPTSPFFTYVVFAIVAATLRWQWRGTLWTGLVAIVLFVGIGGYVSLVLVDPSFELNRFIIRSVYLGVVVALLGYAGYYQQSIEGELARLAAWPRNVSDEMESMVGEIQDEAGAVLGAPVMVAVWEEAEEPWLHVASWHEGRFRKTRLPPGSYGDVVAADLQGRSFLCARLDDAPHRVIVSSPEGPREWVGCAVDPALREAHGISSVMSWPLRGETFDGRLFAAQKPSMMVDDLVLGEVVATLVSSRIDQAYLMERLSRAAAAQARHHLGRDLHDGLLQSLAAIALQLRSVADRIPDPGIHSRLRDLQEALDSEQRDLRAFIRDLHAAPAAVPAPPFELVPRLRDLCTRVERVWPVRVTVTIAGTFIGESAFALDVYRVIHEALVNAARHSGASTIAIVLSSRDASVEVRVQDDGSGFPFAGLRSLPELDAMNLGPVTLRERVARLDGRLLIDSTTSGSTLDIIIPVPPGPPPT